MAPQQATNFKYFLTAEVGDICDMIDEVLDAGANVEGTINASEMIAKLPYEGIKPAEVLESRLKSYEIPAKVYQKIEMMGNQYGVHPAAIIVAIEFNGNLFSVDKDKIARKLGFQKEEDLRTLAEHFFHEDIYAALGRENLEAIYGSSKRPHKYFLDRFERKIDQICVDTPEQKKEKGRRKELHNFTLAAGYQGLQKELIWEMKQVTNYKPN